MTRARCEAQRALQMSTIVRTGNMPCGEQNMAQSVNRGHALMNMLPCATRSLQSQQCYIIVRNPLQARQH
eukprot:4709256-Amphidinium_carterae.1